MNQANRLHPLVRGMTFAACTLLALPILVVLIVSLNNDSYINFPPDTFSLRWYKSFFGDSRWRDALYASLAIGLMTCLISTAIGFLGAYAFLRSRYKAKKFLLSLVLLPLIVPHIITAIALYFVSAPLGLIGSKPWISIAHSVIALPVVVLILISALQNVDESVERAAFSLGANRLTTFRRIVIPLALPGVISAALFSFLTSFDELIIALFLAGLSSETLQVRIWNSLIMEAEPIIAAVSAFLILATIGVLVIEAGVRHTMGRSNTKSP